MNVLFLTLANLEHLNGHSIYGDLLKTFVAHGHEVYAVCPREKRTGLPTELLESCGVHVLAVATGNIQKTSTIEKGLSTAAIEGQFRRAIKSGLQGIRFDLLLYSTPPVSLAGLIASLRRHEGLSTYLLLKDIFPQNAVDLGMLRKSGLMFPVYRHFRHDEEVLYRSSDYIGCMSPANRDYLLAKNPWLNARHVEVNPNSLIPEPLSKANRELISARRQDLGLPVDEKVFVYGGNLGKPQAIDLLIRALALNERDSAGFFAIAGDGTERPSLDLWFKTARPAHAKLYGFLQREQFDALTTCCDAGLVLLDHRFTIPNYPSRILSYMQAGIPLVCATDVATDVGTMAEVNGYGVACDSIDEHHLIDNCRQLSHEEMDRMGENGRKFFLENFSSEISYQIIMRHFETEHS